MRPFLVQGFFCNPCPPPSIYIAWAQALLTAAGQDLGAMWEQYRVHFERNALDTLMGMRIGVLSGKDAHLLKVSVEQCVCCTSHINILSLLSSDLRVILLDVDLISLLLPTTISWRACMFLSTVCYHHRCQAISLPHPPDRPLSLSSLLILVYLLCSRRSL